MPFVFPPQPAAVESSAAAHEAVVGTAPAPAKEKEWLQHEYLTLNRDQVPEF